jgi:hypothetical protein
LNVQQKHNIVPSESLRVEVDPIIAVISTLMIALTPLPPLAEHLIAPRAQTKLSREPI